MTLAPFKKLDEKVIWESSGKWWQHVRATYELPDGTEKSYDFPVSNPAVAIMVRKKDGTFLLQQQYRPFVDEVMYQSVAGGIDEGETPLKAAMRELKEEAGLEARSWKDLGSFVPSAGSMRKTGFVFLAEDIVDVVAEGGDEYALEHEWKTPAEIDEMIKTGELKDAWAIVAWTLTKLFLAI